MSPDCQVCGKAFVTYEQLDTHMANDHNEKFVQDPLADVIQLYYCPRCDRPFKNMKDMEKHVEKAHPEMEGWDS